LFLYSEFQRQKISVLDNPTHDFTANLEMNIVATGGSTMKTLADARERYSAVVRMEKPQKETYTVQIVLTTIPTPVITPVIITVDALERVSAVVLTKKHQNTIVKELTVAVQQNTAVVIMEHQPNRVPTERL
jgi:hypothetical protein